MNVVIKLCRKLQDGQNGNKFWQYFCYRQQLNPANNQYETVLKPITGPDGKPQMVAKSIHVALGPDVKTKIEQLESFPYLLTLTDDETNETKSDYFLTVDKHRDGTVKLDKKGKEHPLLFIRGYRSITPAPRKNMSFDEAEDM